MRLIRPAWDNSERYRELSFQSPGIVRERQREHERILAACAAGDGETAAEELRRHLTRDGRPRGRAARLAGDRSRRRYLR